MCPAYRRLYYPKWGKLKRMRQERTVEMAVEKEKRKVTLSYKQQSPRPLQVPTKVSEESSPYPYGPATSLLKYVSSLQPLKVVGPKSPIPIDKGF